MLPDLRLRLADIQRNIPGIARAYEYAPSQLPETDLPAFINLIGPAKRDYVLLGDGYVTITRDIAMKLFIVPIGSGYDSEAEKSAERFLELVPQYFYPRPALTSILYTDPLASIQYSSLTTDQGISVVRFNPNEPEFLGLTFILNISYAESFGYAPKE